MRKLHVICVAYNRVEPLRTLIDSFICQTNPNWQLYVIYDGKAPKKILDVINIYSDYRILFIESDKRNKHYGHPNRAHMLKRLPKCDDFVLMTNDDNYYVPRFIDLIMEDIDKDTGIVYCSTVHSHFDYDILDTVIKKNLIDMGSFIVRLDIAKENGFNSVVFEADGIYAEECNDLCIKNKLKTIKVNKPLFIHN